MAAAARVAGLSLKRRQRLFLLLLHRAMIGNRRGVACPRDPVTLSFFPHFCVSLSDSTIRTSPRRRLFLLLLLHPGALVHPTRHDRAQMNESYSYNPEACTVINNNSLNDNDLHTNTDTHTGHRQHTPLYIYISSRFFFLIIIIISSSCVVSYTVRSLSCGACVRAAVSHALDCACALCLVARARAGTHGVLCSSTTDDSPEPNVSPLLVVYVVCAAVCARALSLSLSLVAPRWEYRVCCVLRALRPRLARARRRRRREAVLPRFQQSERERASPSLSRSQSSSEIYPPPVAPPQPSQTHFAERERERSVLCLCFRARVYASGGEKAPGGGGGGGLEGECEGLSLSPG